MKNFPNPFRTDRTTPLGYVLILLLSSLVFLVSCNNKDLDEAPAPVLNQNEQTYITEAFDAENPDKALFDSDQNNTQMFTTEGAVGVDSVSFDMYNGVMTYYSGANPTSVVIRYFQKDTIGFDTSDNRFGGVYYYSIAKADTVTTLVMSRVKGFYVSNGSKLMRQDSTSTLVDNITAKYVESTATVKDTTGGNTGPQLKPTYNPDSQLEDLIAGRTFYYNHFDSLTVTSNDSISHFTWYNNGNITRINIIKFVTDTIEFDASFNGLPANSIMKISYSDNAGLQLLYNGETTTFKNNRPEMELKSQQYFYTYTNGNRYKNDTYNYKLLFEKQKIYIINDEDELVKDNVGNGGNGIPFGFGPARSFNDFYWHLSIVNSKEYLIGNFPILKSYDIKWDEKNGNEKIPSLTLQTEVNGNLESITFVLQE